MKLSIFFTLAATIIANELEEFPAVDSAISAAADTFDANANANSLRGAFAAATGISKALEGVPILNSAKCHLSS